MGLCRLWPDEGVIPEASMHTDYNRVANHVVESARPCTALLKKSNLEQNRNFLLKKSGHATNSRSSVKEMRTPHSNDLPDAILKNPPVCSQVQSQVLHPQLTGKHSQVVGYQQGKSLVHLGSE